MSRRRRRPTMPFGKHKGVLVSALPDDYLTWLAAEVPLLPRLRQNIQDEMERRDFRTDGMAPAMTEEELARRNAERDAAKLEKGWTSRPAPELAAAMGGEGMRVYAAVVTDDGEDGIGTGEPSSGNYARIPVDALRLDWPLLGDTPRVTRLMRDGSQTYERDGRLYNMDGSLYEPTRPRAIKQPGPGEAVEMNGGRISKRAEEDVRLEADKIRGSMSQTFVNSSWQAVLADGCSSSQDYVSARGLDLKGLTLPIEIMIDSEIMTVFQSAYSAISDVTLLAVRRGCAGTTPENHMAGSGLRNVLSVAPLRTRPLVFNENAFAAPGKMVKIIGTKLGDRRTFGSDEMTIKVREGLKEKVPPATAPIALHGGRRKFWE